MMRLVIVICVFFLASCSPYAHLRKDLSALSIGMTKEEVAARIGKPEQMVGAKRFDDGTVEIVEHTVAQRSPVLGEIDEVSKYWFFFLNGALDEWGPKERYTMDLDYYYTELYRRHHHRRLQ